MNIVTKYIPRKAFKAIAVPVTVKLSILVVTIKLKSKNTLFKKSAYVRRAIEISRLKSEKPVRNLLIRIPVPTRKAEEIR